MTSTHTSHRSDLAAGGGSRTTIAPPSTSLDLPTDYLCPARPSRERGECCIEILHDTALGVHHVANQSGVPPHVVLLGAFAEVLSRYGRRRDITVTAISDGKHLEAQVDLSGDPTFWELANRVTAREVDTGRHTDVSIRFTTHADGWLQTCVEYDSDIFDGAMMVAMADQFIVLLTEGVERPDARTSELPTMTPQERHRLLAEENDTYEVFPHDECIHQLVEARVAACPDRPAIVFGDESATYRQMNERANQLAHWLREHGVGPDTLVAVCVERGIEMVLALLAVLKAGGAYVPLDPGHPSERLASILADTGARVLLTHRGFDTHIPWPDLTAVFRLDVDWPDLRSLPTSNLAPSARPCDLAYVIYTSGSTGKPKGVQVEHRGVTNFLYFAHTRVGIGPEDVVALEATYCFDIFVFECWGALSAGATLAVISEETLLIPDALRKAIGDAHVTVLRLPASLLVRYLRTHPDLVSGVRSVCYGGETVNRAIMDTLMAGPRAPGKLIHWYGPTETTVISTWYQVCWDEAARQRMAIGRAVPNTRLYVVDPQGKPVPTGVPGELWIGGVGVARGYLNRPQLTRERFIPDPFVTDPRARVYRTGDVVRRLPNGDLEFLYRVDQQVKLRGFRIEPGEVEAVILAHDDVAACVVVTRDDVIGERHLVAYCVPAGRTPDVGDLRDLCTSRLPGYMVPDTIVVIDVLPVTNTGKIDRRALPDPDFHLPASRRHSVSPRGPIEAAIAVVLSNVLGRKHLDVHDDFFALGGHSLLAARVVNGIRSATGADIRLKDFIRTRTIAATAEHVNQLLCGE